MRRVVASGLMCAALCVLSPAAHADIRELTAEAAYSRLQEGEIVLIDVRTPTEWAMTGMPKDSIGITLQSSDFIARARSAVLGDLDRPVALICRTGNRSSEAARRLIAEGFTHVYNVAEGMAGHLGDGDGWIKSGLPTDPFMPELR